MAGTVGSRSPKSDRRLAAQLAITDHDVLLAGQTFETHRAAGVQLISRNANLGTQSVFEAIGEARRGVDHHRRRIDLRDKTPCVSEVFADDRVGVMGAVLINMLDRLVQPVDYADRQNRRQVLGGPVFFGGH